MVITEKEPVKFFEHLDEVKSKFSQKDVFVFLDYDGTLTPIVATPDLAVLASDMHEVLQRLCSLYTVSIVSGRATDDVRGKVRIKVIFYAGSHGFEIVQPDGNVEVNQQAEEIRGVIDEVYKKLQGRLNNVPGARVEHVKYTISTHYRLVSDEDFFKVKDAVEETLSQYSNLRITHGKKVFEIRPRINWDKGKAVEWILKVLNFNPQKNLAVYIGDDTTDEDAFAVLEEKGFGILVAGPARPSKAKYLIDNTDEVKKILELLISLKE